MEGSEGPKSLTNILLANQRTLFQICKFDEDLMQVVLLRSLGRPLVCNHGNPAQSALAWAKQTVWKYRFRKLPQRRVIFTSEPPEKQYVIRTWETGDDALSQETVRAITSLPSGYRETLYLIALEDLTYEEAALKLGVAVGTVMSRMHRARTYLKERLQNASI